MDLHSGVMRVVATTGMPGSGKGLAVEVARDLGIDVVRMGDLVREETEERGQDPGPEAFGRVASSVREEEGKGAWARRTIERIEAQQEAFVLVDGVRSLEEVDVFRNELEGALFVVAILAAPATRYARMKERGRAEDAASEDALRERDLRELSYGLGDVIAMADAYIVNEETREDARSTLRAILGARASG